MVGRSSGLALVCKDWEPQLLVSSFPDEDRLSKRKSIGETISLQVEVESRNSPEKEEASVLGSVLSAPCPLQCTKGSVGIRFSCQSIFLLILILWTSLIFPARRFITILLS